MKKFLTLMIMLFVGVFSAFGQKSTPEEREKALYESVDKTIERYASLLDLADWQIFKIDSMLVHDYKAMTAEIEELSKSKVGNYDIYQKAQDMWNEVIYNGYRSILNDEQWTKYLKQGAARDKKARDKRASKALEAEAKVKVKK